MTLGPSLLMNAKKFNLRIKMKQIQIFIFLLSILPQLVLAKTSRRVLTNSMRFSHHEVLTREVNIDNRCDVHAITFSSSGGFNVMVSKVTLTFENNIVEEYNYSEEFINQENDKGFDLPNYSPRKCLKKLEVTAEGTGICRGLSCGLTWQIASLQPILHYLE